MKKNFGVIFHRAAVTLLLLGAPLMAQDWTQRVAPDLLAPRSNDAVKVIVRFKSAPTERHHARFASRGARLRHDLSIVRSSAYELPASALADLANDPDVEYIGPDRPVHGALDSAEPAINANIAFNNGYVGNGVTVAVIDSGIQSGPDIWNSRIVYNQSFVPTAQGDPFDRYGHGTHVAGIIAGTGYDSSGTGYIKTFRGIAPGVNLVNLRVLDENGQGSDSAVIAAIQAAISLKSTYNIKVINLSVGRPVFESYKIDPLCQAVEQAWKAGIVVVVAAGNEGRNNSANTNGYGTIMAPGNDPYVITVGAIKDMGTPVRTDDLMASYSSKVRRCSTG